MNKHEFITHTESTYSQQQYNNKSKYSSTVITIHKQKSNPTKDRHTATLTTILLHKDWRHPQSFTQSPKKKKVVTSLVRVVPLCDRSLESLRRGAPTSSCRASLAPYARQVGPGFWGSRSSCAAISVRTGWEKGRRSAPRDPREDTLSFSRRTHAPTLAIPTSLCSRARDPR